MTRIVLDRGVAWLDKKYLRNISDDLKENIVFYAETSAYGAYGENYQVNLLYKDKQHRIATSFQWEQSKDVDDGLFQKCCEGAEEQIIGCLNK